ncbi:MAG TPA: hypothetical protein VGI17_04640 [Solirubrobacterales bacterium]|jgi:hypothetical protein
MSVRHLLTALCACFSLLLVLAAPAAASPITVNVRIEGAHETLFEGPLAVEPHGVHAGSDTEAGLRPCDGINALDPRNTIPAPTPTSTSADAMALIGETFDGKWYPGFDDYFITRWGPDREAEGKSWGILVNDTFTSVGGCQYQLDAGDEVLWVFNAFDGQPNLGLFPEDDTSGGWTLTATATLNQPFGVEVVAFEDGQEGAPSEHPGRGGSVAYAGADVSPVTTSAKGFERVETSDQATVPTDSAGKAQIVFTTPGWHRIKATVPGLGEEAAIRSNRLDVCVPEAGQSDCGALPAEDRVRVPPGSSGGELPAEPPASQSPESTGGGSASDPSGGHSSTQPTVPLPQPGQLRVSVPRLDRAQLKEGRLGVTWKVLDAGAGVARWTISSQTLGRKKAPYVRRASGTADTSASLRLPRGHAYRLRFTITDALGRGSSVTIGKVVVPGGGRG